MVGMVVVAEEVLRSERVCCGWMKMEGMVVMPESERPLTPALVSSKALRFFILSSSLTNVVFGAIFWESRICGDGLELQCCCFGHARIYTHY